MAVPIDEGARVLFPLELPTGVMQVVEGVVMGVHPNEVDVDVAFPQADGRTILALFRVPRERVRVLGPGEEGLRWPWWMPPPN